MDLRKAMREPRKVRENVDSQPGQNLLADDNQVTFSDHSRFTFVPLTNSPEHIMSAHILDRFGVAGINYQKADTGIRGSFAVSADRMPGISALAKQLNLRSVFVVSTCNRTEIYGFAEDVRILAMILTSQTAGTLEEFLQYAYLKSGEEALEHLYDVASGLDSQILGDYEILGQLKTGFELAVSQDIIGPVMYRTVNYALQASKKIKTDTAISTGTVSVSYAAIDLLKEVNDIHSKNILVIGAGKFGSNVCRNLAHYLPGTRVSVTNRTNETAARLAQASGIRYLAHDQMQEGIEQADVIIVCTNATEPTLTTAHFRGTGNKLVLDLSVPVSVAEGVRHLENVRVIDVDEISSSILDKNFARRKAEVPRARQIIQQYKQDFRSWLDEYRYSLHLKSWKDKLQSLSEWQPKSCDLALNVPVSMTSSPLAPDRRVQKAVTTLAVKLRNNQQKGCLFINSINDYLQMP